MAARAADVYLMWPDTLDGVAAVIADMRSRAARYGRTLRFGYRAHVIVRATEAYTANLPGLRRVLAPVNSAMIAASIRNDIVAPNSRRPALDCLRFIATPAAQSIQHSLADARLKLVTPF